MAKCHYKILYIYVLYIGYFFRGIEFSVGLAVETVVKANILFGIYVRHTLTNCYAKTYSGIRSKNRENLFSKLPFRGSNL